MLGVAFKLTDKRERWDKLQKSVRGQQHVAVGWPLEKGGQEVHQAEAGEHNTLTNAELAYIHEFGTGDGHIPERAMLRRAWDENAAKYIAMARQFAAEIFLGRMTLTQALERLGATYRADVQLGIRAHLPPPLAASTLRKKGEGKSTPLVDTGQLLNTIAWVVRPGSKSGGG